jgi:hypothetical protein
MRVVLVQAWAPARASIPAVVWKSSDWLALQQYPGGYTMPPRSPPSTQAPRHLGT